MKHIISSLILAFSVLFSFGQSPNWLIDFGGPNGDMVFDFQIANGDSMYIVAYLDSGSASIGSVSLENRNIQGTQVAALVKTDANGNADWGFAFDDESEAQNIAVDAAGNVIIACTFRDTIDLDPGAGVDTMIAPFDPDVFVAKYSPSGNLIWTQRFRSGSATYIQQIAYDSQGLVHVLCDASDVQYTKNFIDTIPAPTAGSHAIWARLSASTGALNSYGLFESNAGSNPTINGIEVDASNNIYLAGEARDDTTDFDLGPGVAKLGVPTSKNRAFVVSYDDNQNFRWISALSTSGGANESQASGVHFSGGMVYTFGYMDGLSYNMGSFSGNVDSKKSFIAKLDAGSGNPVRFANFLGSQAAIYNMTSNNDTLWF